MRSLCAVTIWHLWSSIDNRWINDSRRVNNGPKKIQRSFLIISVPVGTRPSCFQLENSSNKWYSLCIAYKLTPYATDGASIDNRWINDSRRANNGLKKMLLSNPNISVAVGIRLPWFQLENSSNNWDRVCIASVLPPYATYGAPIDKRWINDSRRANYGLKKMLLSNPSISVALGTRPTLVSARKLFKQLW